MTAWLLPVLAGFCTGILSAWGVGGGTLLLLLMTLPFSVIVAMPLSSNGKSLNRESTVKSPVSSLSFCI